MAKNSSQFKMHVSFQKILLSGMLSRAKIVNYIIMSFAYSYLKEANESDSKENFQLLIFSDKRYLRTVSFNLLVKK